ncbi:hypothetical protein [Reyranella sp. CPCC 100927]|uniref:hypothetical protein n=1 Tax=Reyranella sp. CPCC 100927 TaxID=2599616 RepID=UPI0011B756F6|nr:hypothetical protein [Reyranella sp. CPCC 100927]TWT12954.1 hypothetical protein FQU96_11980 [Reyranella sp. CPCC 100927]
MSLGRLVPMLLGASCLMLSACGLPDLLNQSSRPAVKPASTRTAAAAARKPHAESGSAAGQSSASSASPKEPESPSAPAARPQLIGLGEEEVRAKLGAPTTEEERPPGKIWRYRRGGCTVNLSLYPDVQTRKFGTLTYEVKSDDDTDEGKRNCLADLQSRIQAR